MLSTVVSHRQSFVYGYLLTSYNCLMCIELLLVIGGQSNLYQLYILSARLVPELFHSPFTCGKSYRSKTLLPMVAALELLLL